MKEGMHGGIIHCFSYGKEMAREYLNMGLYLGIGGVVTFKSAKKLKEVGWSMRRLKLCVGDGQSVLKSGAESW